MKISSIPRAFVAVAVAAASAALAVWAAGLAAYHFLIPVTGPAVAAGVVALAAVIAATIAAVVNTRIAQREAMTVKTEVVGEVAERVATPIAAMAPWAVVATAFREKPVITLGVTALVGLLAVRYPNVAREIAGAVDHRRH